MLPRPLVRVVRFLLEAVLLINQGLGAQATQGARELLLVPFLPILFLSQVCSVRQVHKSPEDLRIAQDQGIQDIVGLS